MSVSKRLVAEAGSLLFWAERNVGEVLGEAKEGRPKKGETLPSGKDIEATARHRYRKLAQIDEEAALKLRMEAAPQVLAPSEAGKKGGRGHKAIDDVKGFNPSGQGGNSSDYLAARLKRDHPEIERVCPMGGSTLASHRTARTRRRQGWGRTSPNPSPRPPGRRQDAREAPAGFRALQRHRRSTGFLAALGGGSGPLWITRMPSGAARDLASLADFGSFRTRQAGKSLLSTTKIPPDREVFSVNTKDCPTRARSGPWYHVVISDMIHCPHARAERPALWLTVKISGHDFPRARGAASPYFILRFEG